MVLNVEAIAPYRGVDGALSFYSRDEKGEPKWPSLLVSPQSLSPLTTASFFSVSILFGLFWLLCFPGK